MGIAVVFTFYDVAMKIFSVLNFGSSVSVLNVQLNFISKSFFLRLIILNFI